jgi:hypothetical protein
MGPRTPDGVYTRTVDGRTLYVNTTREEKRIPIAGERKESSAIAYTKEPSSWVRSKPI